MPHLSTSHLRSYTPTAAARARRRFPDSSKPSQVNSAYTPEDQDKQDVMTIGGEDPDMEEQGWRDAREYQKSLKREEKEMYQQKVDEASNHSDYVPAQTWEGMEMLAGNKDANTGTEVFER